MEKFWSMAANDEGFTDLYLIGDIASEESWWGDSVTPQQMRAELMAASGEIHVILDSYGGDAFAGNAIYDMLRAYSASGRGKTVAMVSTACSAASIIAMGCDEIRISLLGTIMIHEPWSSVAGNAGEHRATAQVLETIREAQIDAYAQRTGNTRERVLELMQGPDGSGTWMNARMAVEQGFADCVFGQDGQPVEDIDAAEAVLEHTRMASAVQRMRAEMAGQTGARMLQAAVQQAEEPPAEDPVEERPAEDPVEEPPAEVTEELEEPESAPAPDPAVDAAVRRAEIARARALQMSYL